jgi:hypothetical protein
VTPDTDTGPHAYAYDPHLQWAGKAEHTSFEVPTVSLHVHERIDPRTIVEAVRRRPDPAAPMQLLPFQTSEENDVATACRHTNRFMPHLKPAWLEQIGGNLPSGLARVVITFVALIQQPEVRVAADGEAHPRVPEVTQDGRVETISSRGWQQDGGDPESDVETVQELVWDGHSQASAGI